MNFGHTMHSYYSNKSQSVNNSNYTIMVAEVASTVNEIILAENILKKETDKSENDNTTDNNATI